MTSKFLFRRIVVMAALLIGSGIPAALILGQWYPAVNALIDPMTTCWIPSDDHFMFASELLGIVGFIILPYWIGSLVVLLVLLHFLGGTSRKNWFALTVPPLLLIALVFFGADLAVDLERAAHQSAREQC